MEAESKSTKEAARRATAREHTDDREIRRRLYESIARGNALTEIEEGARRLRDGRIATGR